MTCANHTDRERTAFCQQCGKPICPECTRAVGSAIFCEPCLAARLGNLPPRDPFHSATLNQTLDGVIPPPSQPGMPSPGLATLLGLIPGVGAMYNGQYTKGIVHLVVFAVLVSLADKNGIFLLFVFGWVIYQAIEANHTARARLAGSPLPNPFGLNDLGERLGFGKSWPTPPAEPPASAPPQSAPGPAVPPPAPWGAPPQPYTQSSSYNGTTWEWSSYTAPPPSSADYQPVSTGAPTPPPDPALVLPRSSFPAGAIWLIGLGCLFLLGNIGILHGLPVHYLLPFFLIGLGIWIFLHRLGDSGLGLADDGTPMYRLRVLAALRGAIWIILIGVMFLLDTFHILSWGSSWPLFIITAGLMAILQRTIYAQAMAANYAAPPAQTPPPAPTPTPAPAPAAEPHDEERS
ncbi:MAG: B-box zinc finger protein [Acidobacteriota bacterium]|nr:B-box zinc finger protein [Acidobacteriota bacterium]